MKASNFSGARRAINIKHTEEGTPLAELRKPTGRAPATLVGQKRRHAEFMRSEMKRPRELEQERPRLTRIVADHVLNKEIPKDVIKQKLVRPWT